MLAKLRRRRPAHATVVAYLALFVALGGSSYAAVALTRNSVASKHIRIAQVKRVDIAKKAVASKQVADSSLRARDFRPGELPAGPPGAAGEPGERGAPGPTASASATNTADVPITGTALHTVVEATITTEFEARILAAAAIAVKGNGGDDDSAVCRLREASNSDEMGLSVRVGIPDTAADETVVSPVGSVTRPPGTYTIRATCNRDSGASTVSVTGASLIVWAAAL